jgi:hypothetical protein
MDGSIVMRESNGFILNEYTRTPRPPPNARDQRPADRRVRCIASFK